MATISGIRGMLLEEAILYLLRVSGYRTVEQRDPNDKTLEGSPHSGLKVRGRGGLHQIDAIADLMIVPPFTYAQRLLLEAKCYADYKPVELEIIRNAVGVLKDVGEYWVTRDGIPSKARYHYHYALFSASNYTKDAEKYAFAHDIYLIPLAQCQFIQPVIDAIRQISTRTFGGHSSNEKIEIPMTNLRRGIRAKIRNSGNDDLDEVLAHYQDALGAFRGFCNACRQINKAFVAMIAGRFPIFLVPNPSFDFDWRSNDYDVSIHWSREKRERGWYIRSRRTGKILFSFDLPIDIFEYYAEHNMLSAERALDLKEDILTEIQALSTIDDQVRLVRFRLDREWLSKMRETITQIRQE
jgi:hypothetical protein